MTKLRRKFLSICAMFLLLLSQVEAKRNCKPGQEDVIFQPFVLKAQGISRLEKNIMFESKVSSWLDCGMSCLDTQFCIGFNYNKNSKKNDINCQISHDSNHEFLKVSSEDNDWSLYQGNGDRMFGCEEENQCKNGGTMIWDPNEPFKCKCPENFFGKLCEGIYKPDCKLLVQEPQLSSGVHSIGSWKAYCEMPSAWTLVSRFSNKDGKNWMTNASFWFDRMSIYGSTFDPSSNHDMIAEAFWKTPASEIKITRSDDPSHTALLETTSNCLNGTTFREFITSFGDFRNQAVWADDKCLGSCDVKYGGQYQSTSGFEMHGCSSDIQSSNKIGFWCDWGGGDGAVMMIGGGGSSCYRADHGIGITEENEARFGGSMFLDFGHDDGGSSYAEGNIQKSYALNLWVR